jgi:hypothetical protein
MYRYLGCCLALVVLAAPVRADEPPEKLLSPTTQLYLRWDGVSAHKQAYQASVWGSVWAGPTGDTLRTLLAKGPKLLASNLLADPLLDGKPPEDLRAIHTDLKNADKVIELIADKGVVLAAEVREPRPTIRGFGKAIGGLLGGGGEAPPAADLFVPEASVFLIVPDVGDRKEILFAVARLFERQMPSNVEPRAISPLPADANRQGIQFPVPPGAPIRAGCWMEGNHFVLYVGTRPFADVVADLQANAAKGGITGHPLFQRCLKINGFESVARGYVDAQSVVGLARRLAGPFVPGLAQRLDGIGATNLQAVVFSSGFDGKESRALYELDLPGERKGLARILKPQPLSVTELPPMPPDVSRFSALRIDPSGVYDAGMALVDVLAAGQEFGVEEGVKDPAEQIRLRKEYFAKELDKLTGISVKNDLLPHLGDKFVMYQTPTEGLSVFGTVVAVSCKDPARVKTAVDRMQRAFEAFAASPLKVKKKTLQGVEIREVHARGFGVVTPTYAVVGEWLVIAGHPQPVQGFVLRAKGQLESWKPDPDTARRLAKMPADAVGIQYCRPASVVHNLCCIGPLIISAVSRFGPRGNDGDFEPLDIGLIPNGHELGKHLFPNLTVTRDDGRTVRIDVNESFSLPLEFIGIEPFAFAVITGLGF